VCYEQISEVRPSVERIGVLSPCAMARLAELGVRFVEECEYPEAGPTRWAAVRLDDGSERLLVHNYGHPSGFVDVRAGQAARRRRRRSSASGRLCASRRRWSSGSPTAGPCRSCRTAAFAWWLTQGSATRRVGASKYAARVADRVDANGAAYAGSQLQTQLYVNERTDELDAAIRDAFDELGEATFEWRSPLAGDHYAEYSDAAFLKRLGLDDHVDALAKFWARRGGPHWDALALVHLPRQAAPGVLVVEGKSYGDEMLKGSGLSATDPHSTHTIEKALAWTAGPARHSARHERLDGPSAGSHGLLRPGTDAPARSESRGRRQ
jgi:hypothetical protein